MKVEEKEGRLARPKSANAEGVTYITLYSFSIKLLNFFQTCESFLNPNQFTKWASVLHQLLFSRTPWHGPRWHVSLAYSPLGMWIPPLFYTKRKLTANSDGNDILTRYSAQAIHSYSQQNTQWLFSNSTRMFDGICFQASLFARKPLERSRYPGSQRKILPGFIVESRGRTRAITLLVQFPASPRPCQVRRIGS
jgi:hypothetical protein